MRRDFSERSKQNLHNLVSQVENEKWNDFTDWVGDRWLDYQTWIGNLNIKSYINNVNDYHKKVIDRQNATSDTIDTIFKNVADVDCKYAEYFEDENALLKKWNDFIVGLTQIIHPNGANFNLKFMVKSVDGILNNIKNLNDKIEKGLHEYLYFEHEQDKIISDVDYTKDFLEGRNQALDIFASVWSANWIQNALATIGIGENTNQEAVKKSIETLIASTLKDMHKVTDFTDDCVTALTPDELKNFKKVIDYSLSVGRTLTEAEIADLLNIDVRIVTESDYLQFILAQRNLDTINDLSDILNKSVGEYFEFVDAIDITSQMIGKLVNDYTRDIKMLEYIKAATIEQGYDDKLINDTITRLEWEYNDNAGSALVTGLNKLIEEGFDMSLELISEEVSSLLSLFLATKDIGCMVSGLKGQTANLEMIYATQHYSYSLVEKYNYYYYKIKNGDYSQEDIENYKTYLYLARNAKIQEYEAMINLYEEALESANLGLTSSISDVFVAMTTSEEEKQAVKDAIEELENEIKRLKSLGGGTSDDMSIYSSTSTGTGASGGGGMGGR